MSRDIPLTHVPGHDSPSRGHFLPRSPVILMDGTEFLIGGQLRASSAGRRRSARVAVAVSWPPALRERPADVQHEPGASWSTAYRVSTGARRVSRDNAVAAPAAPAAQRPPAGAEPYRGGPARRAPRAPPRPASTADVGDVVRAGRPPAAARQASTRFSTAVRLSRTSGPGTGSHPPRRARSSRGSRCGSPGP